jgi:excinuclease ABC subunit C
MGAADRVSIIAIAKERRSRGTTERIFVPGRSDPLPLAQDSPESLYLQRIRDEAHRFAIKYHRELRKKATLRTGLEEIPGIGKARREAILARFGTLRRIREATEAEIAEVVGPRLATAVYRKLVEAEPAAGPAPPADTPGAPAANPGGGHP